MLAVLSGDSSAWHERILIEVTKPTPRNRSPSSFAGGIPVGFVESSFLGQYSFVETLTFGEEGKSVDTRRGGQAFYDDFVLTCGGSKGAN